MESDPPQTQQMRQITVRLFSPKAAKDLEPQMRKIATEVIDASKSGECDLVRDLTTPAYLGHSEVGFTLRTSGHLMPSSAERPRRDLSSVRKTAHKVENSEAADDRGT
jgi:hypothetical protein